MEMSGQHLKLYNYNLPFGKASRTAVRRNQLLSGNGENAAAYEDKTLQKNLYDERYSLKFTKNHNKMENIANTNSHKRKKSSKVLEKKKGFPNTNSHLNELKTKFARTVCDVVIDNVKGVGVPALHNKDVESDVKENLPDYGRIHTLTSSPKKTDTCGTQDAFCVPTTKTVCKSDGLNTSSDNYRPPMPILTESWDDVEEAIHKRWKSKCWSSLSPENHLPEQ
ncbi:uncharacterized protein LOC125650622 [Ostrea edulis]|uniref:uncharacterized protein LOC125650622 n=1 Tax=Ostrea edulis TaxID=37623 RepID=UPI0024AFA645|nr:uncharacterized protein LOC125650622 [Ostrea edulis]